VKLRLLALAAALATTACGGRFPVETPPAANATQVVIVSQAGKLATSTPIGGGGTRIPATPTFDPSFNSILTPLAAEALATGAATEGTPTPPVRPTRTPAPSATPYPTIELPPAPYQGVARDFQPPPTRTPSPPTAAATQRATRSPTRTATAVPPDPTGPNSDLAHSLPVRLGVDKVGQLNGPQAVDVFSFDVAADDSTIFVTLSGRDAQHYRVFLISPGRQQAAAARPVGSGNAARQIRYPARSETGTWFVEVTGDGKRVPNGPYTLKVDVKEPALAGAG
jgi:predicted small lipoprotein YifL